MNKILTVSIAAYNSEKTLEEVIDSIVKGIDKEILNKIEIIIEDDGSKDKTKNIAESYACLYPDSVIVNSTENGGYGATVNRSIKLAQGKYFKLLDGDDWFATKNLPGFIRFLEHIDADLVISPSENVFVKTGTKKLIDSNKNITSRMSRLDRVTLSDDIGMSDLCVSTKLLRTNNVELIEHCFYTDFEFVYYSLLPAQTIARFPKKIYRYRLGREGQSVSLEGMQKHYMDRVRVVKRAAQFYDKKQGFPNNNNKALIDKKIQFISGDMYLCFTLLEDFKAARKELVEIDSELKNKCPIFYNTIKKKNNIKLLRMTNFLPLSMKIIRGHSLRKNFS